jgi:hypothetical protein
MNTRQEGKRSLLLLTIYESWLQPSSTSGTTSKPIVWVPPQVLRASTQQLGSSLHNPIRIGAHIIAI